MKIKDFTIKEAHEGLKNGEFTSVELTQAYLEEIEKKDKEIKAFITVNKDLALEQAKRADEMIKNGKMTLLTGIPCALKDNVLLKGIKCTAGSKFLENYIATYNASVVKKLEEQGAVFLGKTNLDEFAMGSSCEKSAFFPTKNPNDLERVPGGSSGGSAASVSANMCVYAIGTDTGGSIRQPASFCGVVGLKPTYGSVSRNGIIAFASSLDQVGPLTKNTEDAQIVFEAIKGVDKMDSTTIDYTEEDIDLKNIKIGVPKEYFTTGLDKEIEDSVKSAIEKYKKLGAEIVNISLPHSEYALACYYIIAPAEASSNLARFDGLRYGENTDGSIKNRTEFFGKEVKKRIMLGTYTLSSGYYDAYYKKALKVRTLIKNDFEEAFKKVDVVLGPTSPCLPFKIGEKMDDPMAMYLADIYTVSVNLAGLPAVSLPIANNIGLHLIGSSFKEKKLLKIASLIENKI
ncbi:MAG: Asp-tRNA(Asn)/Glu-tRNA(Gln) amidotransferase subunit GatA [Candidatus Pacebacteria bacterium]|nr:Asp-tRNA(Asn)/Glu-tRNA(Gln) amidotransferase subunit GatA [Candidatus Paceibacterota bacterium]MDD4073980.1 Asp-tRNA(Asn)/Glu-tRNA(Gln) amidotransferase subunit GatA [Candidatus Paceibacterota bacterium]